MKYGFIGCGNMGSAIARAMTQSTHDIMLANRSFEKAQALAQELGVKALASNEELAACCDCIFLGVKPQGMSALLAEIHDALATNKPLLVTMAAGLTTASIQEMAGCELPVVRIMPNTPVSIGAGLILYCANEQVSRCTLQQLVDDMSACGTLDAIDEKLMDAACSVSGCGPAFVYMFLDGLAQGAAACGLSCEKALLYAQLTVQGAAKLAQVSGKSPDQLKKDVCSPGGSTIEGVHVLEQENLKETVAQAVKAAYERNKELAKV